MSVYETKEFAKFARKADLGNAELLGAANAVASGLSDADLGGGVFKQRIAREGGGKSGGFRTIVLFKVGGHSFFVHGFAKNEKANITPKEFRALKDLATTFLGLDTKAFEQASAAGEISEVTNDDEDGDKTESGILGTVHKTAAGLHRAALSTRRPCASSTRCA